MCSLPPQEVDCAFMNKSEKEAKVETLMQDICFYKTAFEEVSGFYLAMLFVQPSQAKSFVCAGTDIEEKCEIQYEFQASFQGETSQEKLNKTKGRFSMSVSCVYLPGGYIKWSL